MTAPALADCYAPVPLAWRHVRVHDVFIGRDGGLWTVRQINHRDNGTWVDAGRGLTWHAADVDPDAVVTVLVPTTERDAATLLRDELGARLIERRTT